MIGQLGWGMAIVLLALASRCIILNLEFLDGVVEIFEKWLTSWKRKYLSKEVKVMISKATLLSFPTMLCLMHSI